MRSESESLNKRRTGSLIPVNEYPDPTIPGLKYAGDSHGWYTYPSGAEGRLVVPPQILVTNNGAHTGSATTDHVLNDVPGVVGHWYGVHLHTQVLVNSVDVNANWFLTLTVDGSGYDDFDRYETRVLGSTRRVTDSTILWTPPSNGVFDLGVTVNELVDGADLTLEGGGFLRRQFYVTYMD